MLVSCIPWHMSRSARESQAEKCSLYLTLCYQLTWDMFKPCKVTWFSTESQAGAFNTADCPTKTQTAQTLLAHVARLWLSRFFSGAAHKATRLPLSLVLQIGDSYVLNANDSYPKYLSNFCSTKRPYTALACPTQPRYWSIWLSRHHSRLWVSCRIFMNLLCLVDEIDKFKHVPILSRKTTTNTRITDEPKNPRKVTHACPQEKSPAHRLGQCGYPSSWTLVNLTHTASLAHHSLKKNWKKIYRSLMFLDSAKE